jgi:hypothetical protein
MLQKEEKKEINIFRFYRRIYWVSPTVTYQNSLHAHKKRRKFNHSSTCMKNLKQQPRFHTYRLLGTVEAAVGGLHHLSDRAALGDLSSGVRVVKEWSEE